MNFSQFHLVHMYPINRYKVFTLQKFALVVRFRIKIQLSTIHVGYVNQRDEALVVLLQFVNIFCIKTSSCTFVCWKWYSFDCLSFLSLIVLQKKVLVLAQSSSKNLFTTHFLFKPLVHFLKMLVETRSNILQKKLKSQSYSWTQYCVPCTSFLQLDTTPNMCIFYVELRSKKVLRTQTKFLVHNRTISCYFIFFAMTKDNLEYNANPFSTQYLIVNY